MNNYVVRIFRADPADREKIMGNVEQVGKKEKKEFRNIEELMAILSPLEPTAYRYCIE